jgi:hypothetical protein
VQNAAEGRFEPFADPNATRPDFHSVRAADVARERVYGNSWHKARAQLGAFEGTKTAALPTLGIKGRLTVYGAGLEPMSAMVKSTFD